MNRRDAKPAVELCFLGSSSQRVILSCRIVASVFTPVLSQKTHGISGLLLIEVEDGTLSLHHELQGAMNLSAIGQVLGVPMPSSVCAT